MRLKKLFPKKLQNRLILFITIMLIFQVFTIGLLSTSLISNIIEKYIGKEALAVARTISQMPFVIEKVKKEEGGGDLQKFIEKIRKDIGAEFIVIGNENAIRLTHPDEWKIGKKMVGGDSWKALKYGKSYISKAVGTLGLSIRGKSPIFDEKGNIIGIVSVGFLMKNIESIVEEYNQKIKIFMIFLTFIGVFGAIYIAKGVKKAIFNLEPEEIAQLFNEKKTIIESIYEGIIALNKEGIITTINKKAVKFLGLPEESLKNTHYSKIFKNENVEKSLMEGKSFTNADLSIFGVEYVANIMPISEQKQLTGCVISLRRKDELSILAKQLTYFQEYSNMLRAQYHEYLNKLHTISGLLNIGEYNMAQEFIDKEVSEDINFFNKLTGITNNKFIIALLIGKYSFAKEKEVELIIDENSSCYDIPEHLNINDIIIILGNIIDNAIEAATHSDEKKVEISIYDYNQDIIFEISDTGKGVDNSIKNNLFQKGFSTKGKKGRGMGLFQVDKLVKKYGGYITYDRDETNGLTVFTIVLPKKVKDV